MLSSHIVQIQVNTGTPGDPGCQWSLVSGVGEGCALFWAVQWTSLSSLCSSLHSTASMAAAIHYYYCFNEYLSYLHSSDLLANYFSIRVKNHVPRWGLTMCGGRFPWTGLPNNTMIYWTRNAGMELSNLFFNKSSRLILLQAKVWEHCSTLTLPDCSLDHPRESPLGPWALGQWRKWMFIWVRENEAYALFLSY